MFDAFWWNPIRKILIRSVFIRVLRKPLENPTFAKGDFSHPRSQERFIRLSWNFLWFHISFSCTYKQNFNPTSHFLGILWTSQNPSKSLFFRNFDGTDLCTGNRYRSEILFTYASKLGLSTVKISASLSEVFGQETRDKIRFFVKIRFSTAISQPRQT